MHSLRDVYAVLRRKSLPNYGLLAGCCFFSMLLITAYCCVMNSPTVLTVLPEGGDSRKQMVMIFVLAVIGCGVFTLYGAGLFLRQKSRELGILLALGAARTQLKLELLWELLFLLAAACGLGAALGQPAALGLWQLFRWFLVDTDEMPLVFGGTTYLLPFLFFLFVGAALCLMALRSVERMDILAIIRESHTAEPVREVPRWYGPAGIGLMLLGALLGYLVPVFCVQVLRWYAPEALEALFYLPVLAGLYMLLLHTVVHGWRRGRNRYRDLISVSLMRFQGRQTVRNMLVITLLIAGGYFAAFYAPVLGAGAMLAYDQRPNDYFYHYRADQPLPQQADVAALAADYGVTLAGWAEGEGTWLGVDATVSVEEDGPLGVTWSPEYRQVAQGQLFLPASAYQALTGQAVELAPGTVAAVYDADQSIRIRFDGSASLVTNVVTGQRLAVTMAAPLTHDLLCGRYVMNDGDYAALTAGLDDTWRERLVLFDVADGTDSYGFARALFNAIVDASGPEAAVYDAYDTVNAYLAAEAGEVYLWSPEGMAALGYEGIDYALRDANSFRLYWKYMPAFRVMDRADYVRTMAIFLMLFVFIAVICFAAFGVIAFTRCLTIALTSARVYEDLRHLGASQAYLYQSARGQVRRVFTVPVLAGTGMICLFYLMIMVFNSEPAGITAGEARGLLACLGVVAVGSGLIWLLYRFTLRRVCRALHIAV